MIKPKDWIEFTRLPHEMVGIVVWGSEGLIDEVGLYKDISVAKKSYTGLKTGYEYTTLAWHGTGALVSVECPAYLLRNFSMELRTWRVHNLVDGWWTVRRATMY